MIQVTIKNLHGFITHMGRLKSIDEATSWITDQVQNKSWGKPRGFYPISQLTQEELAQEISRKTKDDLGNDLIEALIEIPDQYTVVTEDKTAEIDLENQNKKDRNVKRESLRGLKGKSLTAAEVKRAVEYLLDILVIDDELIK